MRQKAFANTGIYQIESDDMEIFYRGTNLEQALKTKEQVRQYEKKVDLPFDDALQKLKQRVTGCDADGFITVNEKDTPFWYQKD